MNIVNLICDELIIKKIVKFIHFLICIFYAQISCIENTFNAQVNVLTYEI